MRGVAVARRRRAVALAVVCAGLFGAWMAPQAGAAVYCVGGAPGCPAGAIAETSLSGALAAADVVASGTNQIILPAGPQTTPDTTNPFTYSGSVPLEIDGQGAQGAGATTLALDAGSSAAEVFIESSGGSIGSITLRSLGVEMPTPGNPTQSGIVLVQPATIANVDVTSTGTTLASAGIAVTEGGTLSHVDVTAPTGTGAENAAIEVAGAAGTTATVQDSTLTGFSALQTQGPGHTIVHRSSLTGGAGGYAINAASPILIDDSVLTAQGVATQGTALLVQSGFAAVGTQLTIVGNANTVGAEALGAGATVNLTDSIIANTVTFPLDSSSPGQVTTDYSDYVHPASYTPGAHDTTSYIDPHFSNAAGGDFRLDATSPLIDFDKATPLGGTPFGPLESSTDFLDGSRITGGGRDLGAFQHQPPTVSAAVSAGSVVVGSPVVFSATGAVGTPADSLSYAWRFDDGATATGPTVAHAFSAAGPHSGTVTVTDLTRLTASTAAHVTVTPAPVVLPSNAFSVTSKRVSKSGVVTLGVLVHAAGRLTAGATFRRTVIHFTGHGRHRRKHTVHETVVYATTSTNATRAGTFTLTLKPTRAALKLLKAAKQLKVTIAIGFVPPGDSLNRVVLHLTVTAPKPPKKTRPKHHG